ncbi:MAG: biotin/lipoyl-binding protein [Clostridia bacterium]|nr:biotin/lipoyl-binding protein [Clostridia bacterium]
MKAYKVNVNGNTYEITIEVIDKADIKEPVKTETKTAPVANAGGTVVKAPLNGTVLKVNVKNGQAVKAGDVLAVLEAMKMENEIVAPCDGVIASVNVTEGASVEAETVVCTLA